MSATLPTLDPLVTTVAPGALGSNGTAAPAPIGAAPFLNHPPPARPPAHFRGMPTSAKLVMVFLAIAMAAGSFCFGMFEMHRTEASLKWSPAETSSLNSMYDTVKCGGEIDPYLFVHLVNTQTHIKNLANQQSLLALTVAIGIALLAIGFGLFVIGADGAFQAHAQQSGGPNVVLYGTAPGLLCFVCATVVIIVGVTRPHTMQLGDFKGPQAAGAAKAETPPAADSPYGLLPTTTGPPKKQAETTTPKEK